MQWLTAILAFATTMLIFAVIVSTLVETIHRALGSRTNGLNALIEHFYDKVISQYITDNNKAKKREFIEVMTLVRAPHNTGIKKNVDGNEPTDGDEPTDIPKLVDPKISENKYPNRWSFQRLTHLPTATLMERLGTSSFSSIVDRMPDEAAKNQLLKDIAQKYESFGQESGLHFESKARLKSVLVAMVVAWIFYVHPYNLIQTYLKNPEISSRVAELASEAENDYRKIIDEAKELSKKHEDAPTGLVDSKLTKENLEKLFQELEEDIKNARTEVEKLSNAGAPIGWPEENIYCKSLCETGCSKPTTDDPKPTTVDSRSNDGDVSPKEKDSSSQSNSNANFCVTVYYPSRLIDIFWLILGGMLIGLGAPFWAKTIRQLTQAQNVSKSINEILKPAQQSQNNTQAASGTPITTEAFSVAADAKKHSIKDMSTDSSAQL